jgi:hypothetical protein
MEGKPLQMGEVAYDKLARYLAEFAEVKFYVVEQFLVRTRRAGDAGKMRYVKEWDPVPAARAIGKIEGQAELLAAPVYFQNSSLMREAAQMFRLPLNRSHRMNAILHGLHYAHVHLGLMPDREPLKLDDSGPSPATVIAVPANSSMHAAWKKAARRSKRRP